MKQIFGALCIIGLIALGGCSTSQLTSIITGVNAYNQSLDNFNAAAAAIDTSIAKTSASLARYCDATVQAGDKLAPLVQKNSNAAYVGLSTVIGGINSYCTSLPKDIPGAISALGSIISDANAAYEKALAGG